MKEEDYLKILRRHLKPTSRLLKRKHIWVSQKNIDPIHTKPGFGGFWITSHSGGKKQFKETIKKTKNIKIFMYVNFWTQML